jgi:hypothetical protein
MSIILETPGLTGAEEFYAAFGDRSRFGEANGLGRVT